MHVNICVYGASSAQIPQGYLDAAYGLGAEIARRGHTLVFGAGDTGVMGQTARGAHSQGGRVIGISPSFFHVDGVLYERCDELILTDTMRERKARLEEMGDAFIAAPGGVGTFEEFFEVLTLRTLGLLEKPIALLNTNGCYDPLLAMLRRGAEERFLTEAVLNLIIVSGSAEEILDRIAAFRPDPHAIDYYKEIERKEAK